ncbi:ATP-binding protein [Pseudoalteromonas denitrificans]|uniref:DNA repair exonuclease SbcCD ATPase subunit n=1 Tax=Pseudoalteromonas denitrificans DSM 6059 TaxID=1123010 RepID=A0A1I1UJ43_9GAMM|nr:ATP-binding protein [Pseudoalteromonas denitrificans]SFD69648.1 DNA repair exonuclease SbcCD ATPase subunit [Pseudoalteromonas denitrificans DSM 6059]
MPQQIYSLLRIIIIDSFWQGQVNELKLTGHTQLEGTNGAGKTSLMRLLPLFYGMRPSDIVSKADYDKNFVENYLPNDSSRLVYEYQRPNGQICMVIASSDGRGAHFKFIDSNYDSQYFIAEDKTPYSILEVERFYRSLGCHSSSFIGIDKFRQVIQNLRSGRKVKEIRQLQTRYSFSDQPCAHVDKVINGTIEKNLDFEAVKKMLVAIASDHLARNSVEEKEQINLNKEEITHWLSDIQASRHIQKRADKIGLWQDDFIALDNILVKLQHVHHEIITHQTDLETKQIAQKESKKTNRAKELELVQKLDVIKTQFISDISVIKAQIDADQSAIDLLDSDKIQFDDDDAANYQFHADKAPRIQNQLHEINEKIEAFEGNINKIEQKFEALIQNISLQKITDIAKNEKQSANVQNGSATKLALINEVHQQQLNVLKDQLSEQYLSLKINQEAINKDLTSAKGQLEQVILAPELLADINQNQLLLNDAQDKQNALYQAQSQLQLSCNEIEKQREKQLTKVKQENDYLEGLRKEYTEVERQLVPDKGSLHYFLTHEPQAVNWKENIGRLLSSEQLSRCDLDPQWLGASNSFYGLSLDLQYLSGNDSLYLDEIELREKREAIDVKRQQQIQKIEQLNEHIGQLTKEADKANLKLVQEKQSIKQNELNIEQLKTQQENLTIKKHIAVKTHKETVNTLIQSLEQKYKNNAKKTTEHEESKKAQLNDLNNQKLEKIMVVETDRDSQLTALADDIIKLTEQTKLRIKALKKQKNTDIKILDPDGEVDKCTQQKNALNEALQECIVYEQKAHKYRHFMNERYNKRDQLVEVNQNRSIHKRNLEHQLEDKEVQLQGEINNAKQLNKKLLHKIQYTEELLEQLSDSHHSCEKNAIVALFSQNQPSSQADLCISFCSDWITQFKVIEKRLTENLTGFNDTFRKDHSSSELFESWQKLITENDVHQGAKTLFKYQKPITDLLSSAEQKQKSTYQLVTVNANIINEFYQHIENFGRRIKLIGNQLSNKVTTLAHFEALADINVSTVMKQDELEYWGPLKSFSHVFEQCRDQLRDGIGDIPDDLVYAMRKLSSYLPSDGFVLSHESLFDIEFTITEKGQVKHARNAKQLKKVSSTGLSYLAMLSLFAGLLGMLRGEGRNVTQIILPVDELGELAAENIGLLLDMFNDNHISILSASPSTDRHILSLYDRHYKLKDNKIFHSHIPQSRLDELLALRAKTQADISQVNESAGELN